MSNYLRHIGADYSRRHVGDPPPCPEWRRVLTVRHPHEVYLSHRYKNPPQTDLQFLALYGNYIWRTQWMDAFYFPLDVPEADRRALLQGLQAWCGLERDMDLIDSFEWSAVGKSKRDRSLEVPEHMIKPLEFAVEWYEYYKIFWGAKIRHTDNMIGEGP